MCIGTLISLHTICRDNNPFMGNVTVTLPSDIAPTLRLKGQASRLLLGLLEEALLQFCSHSE